MILLKIGISVEFKSKFNRKWLIFCSFFNLNECFCLSLAAGMSLKFKCSVVLTQSINQIRSMQFCRLHAGAYAGCAPKWRLKFCGCTPELFLLHGDLLLQSAPLKWHCLGAGKKCHLSESATQTKWTWRAADALKMADKQRPTTVNIYFLEIEVIYEC